MPVPSKVNNLPESIQDLFVGREDFLRHLSERLSQAPGGVVVIHGLGGIGKTRTAIEYGHRHANQFSALLFVDADTRERLRQGLARLAGPMVLDLPEQNPLESEDVQVTAALKWLKNHAGWYLVLDNVDDPDAAKAVRDEVLNHVQGQGSIVVTARHGVWESPQAEQIELGVLDQEAGVSYLDARTANTRHRTNTDAEDALRIVKELGGLALAIEQAAAYVALRRISFRDYLEDWNSAREEILNAEDRERTRDYRRPGPNDSHAIAVTWQMPIDRLGPDAARLLHILAWFAPDPIPDDILEGENLGPTRWLRAASGELLDFALLTEDRRASTIQMHSLVQEVVRIQTPQEEVKNNVDTALQLLRGQQLGDPQNVKNWSRYDGLRTHIESVLTHADRVGLDVDSNELRHQLARFLAAKGLLAKAEPWLRRSLEIEEKQRGFHDPSLASGLTELASILHELNRLGEAESLLRRAINISRTAGENGGPTSDYADALNNLAQVLHDTNRVSEAEELLREALALDESRLGANHPEVARVLSNLALILQSTGRYQEAETYLRRALEIDELTYGSEHPEVAGDLNNYGLLLRASGRLEDAEKVLRQALEIDENIYGSGHLDVARDLSTLALILTDLGKTEEARELIVRAADIHEQCLGSDHPRFAADLNVWGRVRMLQGDMEGAKPLLLRGLEIDEASYGAEHPAVARDLNNLASWYHEAGYLDMAESLMSRAINIYDRLYTMSGYAHPERAKVQENLDKLRGSTGTVADTASVAQVDIAPLAAVSTPQVSPAPQAPSELVRDPVPLPEKIATPISLGLPGAPAPFWGIASMPAYAALARPATFLQPSAETIPVEEAATTSKSELEVTQPESADAPQQETAVLHQSMHSERTEPVVTEDAPAPSETIKDGAEEGRSIESQGEATQDAASEPSTNLEAAQSETAPKDREDTILRRIRSTATEQSKDKPVESDPISRLVQKQELQRQQEPQPGCLATFFGYFLNFMKFGAIAFALFFSLYFTAIAMAVGVILTIIGVTGLIHHYWPRGSGPDDRALFLKKAKEIGPQNFDGLLLRADGSIEVIPPLAPRFGSDHIYILQNPDPLLASNLEPIKVAAHSGASFRIQFGGRDRRIEVQKVSSHEVLVYLDNQLHRIDLNHPNRNSPIQVEKLELPKNGDKQV